MRLKLLKLTNISKHVTRIFIQSFTELSILIILVMINF